MRLRCTYEEVDAKCLDLLVYLWDERTRRELEELAYNNVCREFGVGVHKRSLALDIVRALDREPTMDDARKLHRTINARKAEQRMNRERKQAVKEEKNLFSQMPCPEEGMAIYPCVERKPEPTPAELIPDEVIVEQALKRKKVINQIIKQIKWK